MYHASTGDYSHSIAIQAEHLPNATEEQRAAQTAKLDALRALLPTTYVADDDAEQFVIAATVDAKTVGELAKQKFGAASGRSIPPITTSIRHLPIITGHLRLHITPPLATITPFVPTHHHLRFRPSTTCTASTSPIVRTSFSHLCSPPLDVAQAGPSSARSSCASTGL